MRNKFVLQVSAFALALVATGCGGHDEPKTERPSNVEVARPIDKNAKPVASPANSAQYVNWAAPGGAANESGYSALDQITTENVGELGLDWYFDLPNEVSLEAIPLAVDGVIYFSGSYSAVYAVDAVSGELLWKHDPEIWSYNPRKQGYNLPVNRGVAYDDGIVFASVLDGRLLALEAKTGELVWSQDTVPPTSFHTITGAPRTFDGKVIIGNSGADAAQRGYVTAYDQKTGEQVWRFYTVPGSPEENAGNPAMEMAAESWSGEFWKTGTGGTVWNGMTYDPELGQIYIGVGNGGPYSPRVRSPEGGDNLFLASIVALDVKTGEYKWHYQANPGEAWDYKNVANMIAATVEIDGAPRKVLMQAPTNGFFYVLDRETGKLLSAEKTGKVTWAEKIDLETGRPVEYPNIRYETGETIIWPSMIGSHNWQPMSFNPQSGLVYIPYMQLGGYYRTEVGPGDLPLGGVTVEPYRATEKDGTGALLAWDPVTQSQAWKQPIETIWNGGTLTTGGNLVFQGTGDGYFSAYNAKTGERLLHFYAGLGIIGAPSTYSIDGKQYVSVLVGYGGTTAALSSVLNAGWKYGAQTRRLLTFSLEGEAELPPQAPRDMTVDPLDDPDLEIDPNDVLMGKALFIQCGACHGMNAVGAGSPGPDLRESKIALNADSMWAVVSDGALVTRGMPQFSDLTREQSDQIFAFIRQRARESIADGGASDRLPVSGEPTVPPTVQPDPSEVAGPSYSVSRTTIGELIDTPETRAILDELTPGLSTDPQIEMGRGMTLRQVQPFAPDKFPDALLEQIDTELQKLGAAEPVAPAYSVSSTTIGELIDNPETLALLDKHFPGMATDPQIEMGRGMTITQVQPFAADMFTDEKIAALSADLAALGGGAPAPQTPPPATDEPEEVATPEWPSYSVEETSLDTLLEEPGGKFVGETHLQELLDHRQIDVVRAMSLAKIQSVAPDILTDEKLAAVAADFVALHAGELDVPMPDGAGPRYSTATTTIGELIDTPETRAVLDARVPGMSTDPQIEMGRPLTLQQVQQFAPGQFTDELLAAIDADFAALDGLEPAAVPTTPADAPAPTEAMSENGLSVETVKIGEFVSDPELKAILDKHLPGVSTDKRIGMAKGMTLKQVQRYNKDQFTDEVFAAINTDLAKIDRAADGGQ